MSNIIDNEKECEFQNCKSQAYRHFWMKHSVLRLRLALRRVRPEAVTRTSVTNKTGICAGRHSETSQAT